MLNGTGRISANYLEPQDVSVESVKAASDIYAPVAGVVVEVNEALQNSPELANGDPYGDGWFFRLRADDADADLAALLDAAGYEGSLDED